MRRSDFIYYLTTLSPEDWEKKVTAHWSVKDVVAHLVGWEKEYSHHILQIWETKQLPWFRINDDHDKEFNERSVAYYKNYKPKQLVKELEKWQYIVREGIDRIGEETLRAHPELFGWLFDESDKSHYARHYRQIKQAVERVLPIPY